MSDLVLDGTAAAIEAAQRTAAQPRRNGSTPARFGACVAGLGVALPEQVIDNAPIAARLGIEPDWIVSRTGIHERRAVAPGERLSDLAAEAARRALADAGIEATDVDLLLVATTTSDEITPHAAPLVATAIGATRAGAIDVNGACAGFLSGLALGAAYLESGRAQTVLLVGVDILTRYTNPDDRRTAALFGDGAGAAVLSRTSAPGALAPVLLASDGSQPELLVITRERLVVEMEGQEVFKHAIANMTQVTLDACAAAGIGIDDVDLFVYHQANARITRSVGQRLALDPAKVVDCIATFGNMSAASIPVALEVARAEGRLQPGARVLVSAFGAGFVWGATILEWGDA